MMGELEEVVKECGDGVLRSRVLDEYGAGWRVVERVGESKEETDQRRASRMV